MKTKYKIIGASIFSGLFLWVIDAVFDSIIFLKGSFLGLLIFNIPAHEFYDRSIILVCFVIFGILLSMAIEKRKRVEEKTKEIKESYERIIDNADEAIFRVGARGGNVSYVNPAAERLLGYSSEEWLSDHSLGFKIILPDFVEKQKQIIEEININKKPIKNNVLGWRAKDGREIFIEYTVIPILDEEGEIIYFESIGRDITERKKVEEALQASLKTASDLIYSTPYGLFIYQYEKPDRLILVSGNPEAERLTGIKIDDWIGKENNEIWPEARKTGVTDAYLKVMKTGETYETEDLYYKDEKLEGVFSIRAFRLPDEKLCVSFENVTERKNVERALQSSEEKYRSLIESSDDLIYLVDKNYSYLFMNKKHAERFNLPFKKIIGRFYSEFHSKKESDFFKKDVNKVIRTGKALSHEHKSDRDDKFYLRTFSPVKNEEEKVVAVNVISKDISELKQVEHKLKQSEQEIHKFAEYLQSAREKERALVASELHDEVGQALTGIKMDIFMIKNKLSKDKKEIPSEFQKMEKLLDDTTQKLRKIYSELRPSLLEHFGIGEAIKQFVADFQEQSGTKCTFYQDPEEITLDENSSIALYRILQGGINNIKWHSEATKVNIRLVVKGPNLKLTIRDNGKGITEEQIKNSDSFGLIGMRERARFLGGELEIKGLPNKGTTIKLEIPIKKKRRAQDHVVKKDIKNI